MSNRLVPPCGHALVFIHILCQIVSERGGRDRFPNGPREWWANGMPLRPKHSQFIRPDASEKRPCHGIRQDVYKDQGHARDPNLTIGDSFHK